MKTFALLFLLGATVAQATTYRTEVSAMTNPASGNIMSREKIVKVHLMAPTTPGESFHYLKWNGETSGSWMGGSATTIISYGGAEVVHSYSGEIQGLLPWGAGESFGLRYTRRVNGAGADLDATGFTVASGPYDATAGNGDANWGWDSAEEIANTTHLYIGGPPPPTAKPIKVRFNYTSWCPEPQALSLVCGDGSSTSMTPVSGTREAPSSLTTFTWDFTPGAVTGGVGNYVEVRTSTGAVIKRSTYPIITTGSLAGTPLTSEAYYLIDLAAVTIACDAAPAAPATENTTDNTTGTGTQTTTTGTPATQGGQQGGANGATTTTTDTQTTPPDTTGGVDPPPPGPMYSDQSTQYQGTGNKNDEDMKKQDFYDVTKQALTDAGRSGTVAAPAAATLEDLSKDDTGKAEDLEAAAETANQAIEDTKSGMMAKLSAIDFSSLPTSIGTVDTIELTTAHFGAQTAPITIRLQSGPFAGAVSILRAGILFAVGIGWMFLCLQTVKGYL